jgi:branched-chain amino acid transport system substrate-binding protein
MRSPRRRAGRTTVLLAAVVAMVATACGVEAEGDPDTDPDVAEEPADEGDDEAAEEPDADEDAAAELDGEPIKFGFVGELSGNFAIWGEPTLNGMQMAVDEINAEGGVDGRPLELVSRDTEGSPDEGIIAFEELIDQEGIVAAGGLISSDVGLATARVAEADGIPLFLVKAGSEAILTQDSRYTFRTCLPAAPMNRQPLAQFIESEGITRVGAIIADYAWGRAIEGAINDQIGALDVELQVEVAPVPETDFTTYLRSLEGIDPEIIIATGHPPGSAPITNQAADLGFDVFVTGPNSPLGAVFGGIGDAAYDRYVDFSCADYDSADYQELASRYYEEFGSFMEDDAVSGYGQIQMVAEAIREGGSDDPADIAEYLHANSFDLPGYAFTMEWTEWGEMAAAQPLLVAVREQEAPEGVNPGANWYPEVLFQADVLEPFVP